MGVQAIYGIAIVGIEVAQFKSHLNYSQEFH